MPLDSITRLRSRLRNGRLAVDCLRRLRSNGVFGSRGGRRKLSTIGIYATNLCNSRCEHCGIWEQRPITHLPLKAFAQIHDSPATSPNTVFFLGGGEFCLHPQADEILEMFYDRQYFILSNGLAPERIRDLVRKHRVQNLILSLDGRRRAYEKIRGVDGFDRVTSLAAELGSETKVFISYTVSPWNNLDDFRWVQNFCLKHGLIFGANFLHCAEYFDRQAKLGAVEWATANHLPNDSEIATAYFTGYNRWLSGELLIPCTSIFKFTIVYPDGSMPLCQQYSNTIIGNVLQKPLEEIWWSPETIRLQRQYLRCTACWISCHRHEDLPDYLSLKKVIPEKMIRRWMQKASRSGESS